MRQIFELLDHIARKLLCTSKYDYPWWHTLHVDENLRQVHCMHAYKAHNSMSLTID